MGYIVVTGVSMDSASDYWAVRTDNNTATVLLLHWNGTSWTRY